MAKRLQPHLDPLTVRAQDLPAVMGMSVETVQGFGIAPIVRQPRLVLFDYRDLVALRDRLRTAAGVEEVA